MTIIIAIISTIIITVIILILITITYIPASPRPNYSSCCKRMTSEVLSDTDRGRHLLPVVRFALGVAVPGLGWFTGSLLGTIFKFLS